MKVTRIDRAERLVIGDDGRVEPYDHLVIATGSSAFVPPLDGLVTDTGRYREGVFVFRTLDDCSAIRDYAAGARRARRSSAADCSASKPRAACVSSTSKSTSCT